MKGGPIFSYPQLGNLNHQTSDQIRKAEIDNDFMHLGRLLQILDLNMKENQIRKVQDFFFLSLNPHKVEIDMILRSTLGHILNKIIIINQLNFRKTNDGLDIFTVIVPTTS